MTEELQRKIVEMLAGASVLFCDMDVNKGMYRLDLILVGVRGARPVRSIYLSEAEVKELKLVTR